ncbi:MAG: hypothetical protein BRC29_03840 [Nanohaloarchaea archaeon SW_7_43_1]|nr:MAG: hypothetical protein BRC29_03840 [Nanohaloarchaea archaeon SW_7_43_1]
MSSLDQIILALNTAGTLTIGSICFFIVYTTFRGIEDDKIQEFSKRFLMAIAVLLLYVSYLMVFNTFFQGYEMARYPLYLILVVVFLCMIYAATAFEKIAKEYGISHSSKMDKMKDQEQL